MRSFASPVAFLLLAFGLCSLPWSSALPACTGLSEIGCSKFTALSSVPSALGVSKRQDLTNAERLKKRLPLLPPPTRILARHGDHPQPSPVPKVTYSGVIQVFTDGVSLGYIAPDPNYWTPLLTPDINSALRISFQLDQGATSGSQLALTQLNDNRGTFFAPVVGRDSTSSDIAPGSFNYLYLDPVAAPGTPPGSTPQSAPSFFSTSTGLDKQTETSVWNVDLPTGALALQWINTDATTPATIVFVQSNHVYAGGDPNAFHSRFPAPVTPVTLKFIPA
jgi:hypothetical protein